MICDQLTSLLGFDCLPLSEDGSVAKIDAPFIFDDGDALPIYVQKISDKVRFFDDGGVILHFLGRGMKFDDARKSKFIKNAAEPHGVVLTNAGELEIWASVEKAPQTFAKYMTTLLSLVAWERDQRGVNVDVTLLVDEVAMYLKAWKPMALITREPEYVGISGQTYKLDLNFDGQGVVATSAHPNSVSASIKKLLDIRSSPHNINVDLMVVIDDRQDRESAAKDSLVIQNVAKVMQLSSLEKLAPSISHH